MADMTFCELKQKEVINVRDCMRLGYVSDLDFEPATGCIRRIIVPGPCRIFGLFGSENEYCIDYCNICQIGPDIILVDIDTKANLKKGCPDSCDKK